MGGEILMKDLVFRHSIFDGVLSNINMRLKAAQVDKLNLNLSWKNLVHPIQVKAFKIRFILMPICPK